MPTTAIIPPAVAIVGGLGLSFAEVILPPDGGIAGTGVSAGTGLTIATAGVVATIIASLIGAFGDKIVKPYLESRIKKQEITARELERKVEELAKNLESSRMKITEIETQLEDSRKSEIHLIEQLTALTQRNREQLDKNLRLAHLLLVAAGRLKQGEFPLSLTISDDPNAPNGPLVLLVEDNKSASIPMTTILEAANFRVETVETLAEGYESLSHKPDIMLLDLMLPDGDGADLLRRVRASNLPIKVIVTTGKSAELLGDVKALKPDGIFRKPIDLVELVGAMTGVA